MEENKLRLEARDKKKEPECINQHSSSHKIIPTKLYAQKARIARVYEKQLFLKNYLVGLLLTINLIQCGFLTPYRVAETVVIIGLFPPVIANLLEQIDELRRGGR